MNINNSKPFTNKMKKPIIPVISMIVALLAIVLIAVPLLQDNNSGSTTTSSSDKATIDHLKGENIGNNSAMSEITNYVFYDQQIESIELQTKTEPYGITVNATVSVPDHLLLKYAVYVFSLIDNAHFVEVATNSSSRILERSPLEDANELQFAAIEGDHHIMSTYYKLQASKVPQLQMKRDDAYKLIFNALNAKTITTISDWTTNDQPAFSLSFEQHTYLVWQIEENEAINYYFVNIDKPMTANQVSGNEANELQQYVTRDYELVTGTVVDIVDDQLNISLDNTDSMNNYLVTVDNGKDYAVGDFVTAWASMVTMSLPAQATATKILRK